MTLTYSICEPHPSVPSSSSRSNRPTYLPSGRGGAGNIKRYNTSLLTPGPSSTGPASRSSNLPPPPSSSSTTSTSSPTSSSTKFTASGRGGAGNMHNSTALPQRQIFSFDEELARDERVRENLSRAPVYHIGRGGAGNAVNEMVPRGGGRAGGSVSSGESGNSSVSFSARNIFRTLSRTVSRESRSGRD